MAQMACPACHGETPPGSRFCLQCGAALGSRCGACGAELPGGSRFCNQCGATLVSASARDPREYTPRHLAEKILASKSALEGERKQVTVLFADVKSSMELAESVDPEEWHRILDRFFQILADGVHRFEGTINQYTGDGVMALFGAPIAHEDHAQRACYAALQLQQELRRYANELRLGRGLDFAVRIGIHSGEVVVGKIGDDLRMDYTAQGAVVGLAARLQALAEAGKVYVSGETARRVEGYFRFEDLGTVEVKGVGAAVRVLELAGTGVLRTRFDVSRSRGLSRFVGRTDETAALDAALDRALAGDAPVIGVVAEAGVGKSRLCFELLERCRARGIAAIAASGVAHGKAVPLLPILELLRNSLGITEHDPAWSAREKIAGRLLLLDEGFREALPLAFDFLGVTDPERPAPTLDADARQRALFDLFRRVTQLRGRREPFVTLLEDLHWFDAASEAFLETMVDVRPGTRALLVLNFRPEFHATWMQRSWYQQLPLRPLGPEAQQELLRELLGDDPSLAGLASRIGERTGGNPFFLEETVLSLAESGALAGPPGGYRLARPLEEIAVPATVQIVLAARIDRLAEREKSLLQTASVIGRELPGALLRQVADLPERDLTEALRALVRGEFLYEAALHPDLEYAFKHPLTQEVAYQSQLAGRRARVHAAVARALEAADPAGTGERAALLAHHYEAAGEALPAARWHDRAAHWALRADYAEARRHWERVRALAGGLPESRESADLLAAACAQLLLAGSRLGLSEAEATTLFEEGRVRVAGAASPRLQVMLLIDYARWRLQVLGTPDAMLEHGHEAQRIARSAGDREALLMANWSLGFGCWAEQRIPEALARFDEIVELAAGDARLGTETLGWSVLGYALASRVHLHALSGRFDAVDHDAERAATLAAGQTSLELSAIVHFYTALAEEARGDAARTAAHARALFALRERVVNVLVDHLAEEALGMALLLDREWARAAEAFERVLADIRTRRLGLFFEPMVVDRLAEALLGMGDLAAAEARAREMIEIARTRRTRMGCRGPLLLARVVARARGAKARAEVEQLLEEAAADLEATGARALVPMLHEARAELERACGAAAAAERELREAQRLYAGMGATGHAERLARELAP
jgi:class 3 adenylate cyclase